MTAMFEYSQSYNRYSYCFNNPLRFTDPSGYVVRGRNDVLNPYFLYYDFSSFSSDGSSFNTDIVEGSPSPISFNLLFHSASLDDGLVYGHITLKRYPNHKVRAYSDRYDFEMHSWKNPLNYLRNIETMIGKMVSGNGNSYEINIYGETELKPILPWIK